MRVLIVDDDQSLVQVLTKALHQEGYVVQSARDGRIGLWLAQENPYDVILLDIMLPLRHGYDVLRALRAGEVWTPIMMLSAKDGEYDQTDAFELGADDYLTKPFNLPILLARLQALARRGAPQRPVVLHVGDLTLDPSSRRVTCQGEPVQLTAKEYALLHFLMRHPDTVMSRFDILDNVWDPEFNGSENIVEIYVGYLRRKIDTRYGGRRIETVRGAGYRLLPGEAA